MSRQSRRGRSESRRPDKSSYREKMSQRDTKTRTTPEKEGFGAYIPPHQHTFDPRTENQRILYSIIKASDATFATGPGGTGKTHVAIEVGVEKLLSDRSSQLVLVNPGIEIGVKLGFLPGGKDDKIALSIRPMTNILKKLLGTVQFEDFHRTERILFEPLGSVLGNTYDNAMIVFDEAQNSTPEQMKALLIRLGHKSKIAICGDYLEQKFIPGRSGLEDALSRIGKMPGVGHVDFTLEDIVRSSFCKRTIAAYRGVEL
jgi:phosphate starvation-inducible PhoH-like protein